MEEEGGRRRKKEEKKKKKISRKRENKKNKRRRKDKENNKKKTKGKEEEKENEKKEREKKGKIVFALLVLCDVILVKAELPPWCFYNKRQCERKCIIPGKSCQRAMKYGLWMCADVDCGIPFYFENGIVDTKEGTTFEHSAIYRCDAGYMIDYEASRTCLSSGEWSGPEPKCEPIVDCEDPDVPTNGMIDTPSGTKVGSPAIYNCSGDYILKGQETRWCLISGIWSGIAPTCDPVVDCEDPDVPSNGMIDTPSGTKVGSPAIYNCSSGYILNGQEARWCLISGIWSGIAPTCDPVVDCNDPAVPDNGMIDLPSGTTVGSPVMYNCSSGYVLNGDMTRWCLISGEWSGKTPTCDPIVDCGDPEAPGNGTVDTPTGTTVGNPAIYECNGGFYISSCDARVCLSTGEWSGTMPTCTPAPDCGDPATPGNGTVSTPTGTTEGNPAIYECFVGYMLNGQPIRICLGNGMWSGVEPTCDPMGTLDCGDPDPPANGTVTTPTGTEFGHPAIYACDDDFVLSSCEIRTCLYTGVWSGITPTCDPIPNCGDPPAPMDGMVTTPTGTTEGNVALYNCFMGFVLNGQSIRICLSSGVWGGVEPTCDPIVDCNAPGAPTNGTVDTPTGTTVGNPAIYDCEAGFQLSTCEIRICLSTGIWSGTVPTCVPAPDCGDPPAPGNGTVMTPDGTSLEKTAIYECDEGFVISAPVVRICLSTGMWSYIQPTCDPIPDCGTPADPTDGMVSTPDGTSVGKFAMYACDDGYVLSGTSIRVCQSDGMWSPLPPTCSLVDCGTLEAPCNGQVVMTTSTVNSTATYTCEVGFALDVDVTRTCQSNGEWSGGAPCCEIALCGNLAAPTNGTMDFPSPPIIGSMANFTCGACYTLMGSSTLTCLETGLWDAVAPTCDLTTTDYIYEFGTSCYRVETIQKLSWQTSQNGCANDSATLIEIESAAEQTFIEGVLSTNYAGTDFFWIGGHDKITSMTFMWYSTNMTIASVGYENYATSAGEPNHSSGEDCLVMWMSESYQWGDADCVSPSQAWICEKDSS